MDMIAAISAKLDTAIANQQKVGDEVAVAIDALKQLAAEHNDPRLGEIASKLDSLNASSGKAYDDLKAAVDGAMASGAPA